MEVEGRNEGGRNEGGRKEGEGINEGGMDIET